LYESLDIEVTGWEGGKLPTGGNLPGPMS
jgi:hypothetical protein